MTQWKPDKTAPPADSWQSALRRARAHREQENLRRRQGRGQRERHTRTPPAAPPRPVPDYPLGNAGAALGPVDGSLRVLCWCGREQLKVPTEQVAAGKTGSCGRPECRPPLAGA